MCLQYSTQADLSCAVFCPAGLGPDMRERTLIAVKPDGVQRRLVGQIIQRFEQRGFKLVGLKMLQVKMSDTGSARVEVLCLLTLLLCLFSRRLRISCPSTTVS